MYWTLWFLIKEYYTSVAVQCWEVLLWVPIPTAAGSIWRNCLIDWFILLYAVKCLLMSSIFCSSCTECWPPQGMRNACFLLAHVSFMCWEAWLGQLGWGILPHATCPSFSRSRILAQLTDYRIRGLWSPPELATDEVKEPSVLFSCWIKLESRTLLIWEKRTSETLEVSERQVALKPAR